MGKEIYKKARTLKGLCEVCGHYVRKGDYFSTTGSDGHGGITGLTHKTCAGGKPYWLTEPSRASPIRD